MLHPHHHALMFFIIILLFSSLNYSQSLTTHGDDERGILLSLKQEYWGNPSSLEQWNSTSSPCDWPGISCNFNGSVTGIYLYDSGLEGSFPSKVICQLNNLSSIDFRYNSLWGTIPVGLSSCSKLEELDLSANNFTGKIPGDLFSMKTLRTLRIQENMLSGEIPTPIAAYSLEYLDLSSNHLSGSIPDDIANLNNLRYLDLSSNSFTGSILEGIGNLYNLLLLDLSRNSFTGPIPDKLSQLHQLSHLSLSCNNLTGEIPEKLELFSLNNIDLSHNHLSGTISRDFRELLQLGYMNVSHNHLSGDIWETASHLPATMILDICWNNFSGRFPYAQAQERFSDNCFDEANLCSDAIENGLPACSTHWCSEYIDCSSKPFHRLRLRLQARTIMSSSRTSSIRRCCDHSESRWWSCSTSGTDSGDCTTSSVTTNFSNSEPPAANSPDRNP